MTTPERVHVAVVTGAHPFEVPAFHRLFRSLPGVVADIQTLEDWTVDVAGARDSYDVVVFYNFHQAAPEPSEHAWADTRGALENLRNTGQGILVLHHAILAYPTWSTWSELVGIEDRVYTSHRSQTLRIHVEDPIHPIAAGVDDWDMVDETYTMAGVGAGNEVLFSADHALSMQTLGWTRRFGASRVFCLQSGHDHTSFDDADFRRVLSNGIRWLADRE